MTRTLLRSKKKKKPPTSLLVTQADPWAAFSFSGLFGLVVMLGLSLMSKCQNRMTSGNSSISQRAALAALEGDQQVITEMRRDYMYRRLNAMDGVRCGKAEGAFYLMPDMREFMGKQVRDTPILTTTALAEYILQEAKVVITDGESFNYPGFVRISYSNSMEQIEKAMDRMEIALRKLL